jgi:predicted Zn finger-like uncharacterized protein/putative nucleotidyltransferase with HDIG domain
MKFECTQCRARYRISEEQLPQNRKFKVKCQKCDNVIRVDFSGQSADVHWHELLPDDLLYGDNLLNEVTGNFKKLYPMGHVMWKVRALATDPEVDLKRICELIKTDQALAVRLLKVANSAYFGLKGRVSSIQHAAAVLGTNTLVQIVTLIGNSKMLRGTLPGYELESGTMWRHALTVAAGSDIIAKKLAPVYASEAFLTGLLHDAGKMILDAYIVERKEAFTALLKQSDGSPVSAENTVLGLDHAAVGRELCIHWNLPDFVADAIKWHHTPFTSNENILANIIYAADAVANSVNAVTFETELGAVQEDVINFLRINETQLESLAHDILEAVESLEETTY